MRRIILVGWVGLSIILTGLGPLSCARKQAPAGDRPDTLSSDGLRASITQQVGTAACKSPTECRTLPLGVKPCGGPRRYLVYSIAVTDSARLVADAARFNEAEARKNREQGQVSDCSMLMAPRVSCVSGKCAGTSVEGLQPQ